MKTTEEIRLAVLAECERLCPQIGDKSKIDGIDTLRIDRYESGGEILQYTDSYQWEKVIEFNHKDHWREKCWRLAYRLLGLSERDAVEDYKAEWDNLQTAWMTEKSKVAALEARNAKLVGALEEIHTLATKNGEAKQWVRNSIGNTAIKALHVNEKGGANG